MLMLNCLFFSVFVGVLCISNDIIVPCKKHDWECMTQISKKAVPKIAVGVPSLGIESADPLHMDKIEGNLSTMKYTLTDSIITGMKNCDINNVRLDVDELYSNFNLTCRDIENQGKYKLSGRLIVLPVEGDGNYKIYMKKYEIAVRVQLKIIEGSDGKQYLAIKKSQFSADAQEKVTYDFTNLFNGQKILADTVLDFANSNWKEVIDYIQDPVLDAMRKKLVIRINKLLKSIPVEEIVL